jgi:hypothetical protein
MKYVPDATRRFRKRPHFEPKELDFECETIISDFLLELYGSVTYPIPTDALTSLLERHAADLDLYADLSGEGPEVEGVTDFFPGTQPKVRIARELSEEPRRENRLRTTLTHEFGHVKFHGPLFDASVGAIDLFPEFATSASPKCKRDNITGAPAVDWMEWQAGYVCGAILMPRTAIVRLYKKLSAGSQGPLLASSAPGVELQAAVVEQFGVSGDAAHTRLLKLQLLSDRPLSVSLF